MHKHALAVLAVVLVAGCVGQTTTTTTGGGPGLAITSLTVDTAEQGSGRDIRIFGEFENQGESTVRTNNSLVALIGPTGSGLLEWQLQAGSVVTPFRRDLRPADIGRDLPAGRDALQWRVRAPQLDPGQRKTDAFTVRAYYNYETKAVGEFVAYSEAESTAISQRGESLDKAAFSTTRGPIALSIRSVPDPVVALGSETVTLEMVISNEGGGTVYRTGRVTGSQTSVPSLSFDDLNKVNLKVETNLTEATSTNCKAGAEQELIGGKPTTVTCDFQVPSPATKQAHSIKVSLTYGYQTESNVQLTAVGR